MVKIAWTAMSLFTPGVLTSAQLNVLVNNLNETAPGKFTASGQILIGTGSNAGAVRLPTGDTYTGGGTDASNSTTYGGLNGGPSFGVVTGTKALVMHGCLLTNDGLAGRSLASYSISNATTVAASDAWSVAHDVSGAGRIVKASFVYMHSGLTAGTNIFTFAARVTANTGTFTSRSINVFPLS